MALLSDLHLYSHHKKTKNFWTSYERLTQAFNVGFLALDALLRYVICFRYSVDVKNILWLRTSNLQNALLILCSVRKRAKTCDWKWAKSKASSSLRPWTAYCTRRWNWDLNKPSTELSSKGMTCKVWVRIKMEIKLLSLSTRRDSYVVWAMRDSWTKKY